VTEFVTVDGVMEGPGHHPEFERTGWVMPFDRGTDGDKYKLDELMDAEALLLGRRTYVGFAAAWPQMTDEEGFADKMNSMPKYVVSTKIENPTWQNTSVIGIDEVDAVKKADGGDLLVAGSASLAHWLADRDLVDEYRLMVFPVLLGAGLRVFDATSASAPLSLIEARPVGPQGVTVMTYRRAR
jgi:dihydrofolate reductase